MWICPWKAPGAAGVLWTFNMKRCSMWLVVIQWSFVQIFSSPSLKIFLRQCFNFDLLNGIVIYYAVWIKLVILSLCSWILFWGACFTPLTILDELGCQLWKSNECTYLEHVLFLRLHFNRPLDWNNSSITHPL